jgi:hypothetical protein
MMQNFEIVLLGGPNSGKTHFAGQLYGRLQRRPGALQLRKSAGTPSDLSALNEVLRCLEDGQAAEHTPVDTSVEVILPLIGLNGKAFDLRWPDYGGEQIRSVFDKRAVPERWRLQLEKADGWVLLIRLKSEVTYPDALAQLRNLEGQTSNAARAGAWDANARWVELLQILLHVSGVGVGERLKTPRLAVLLSCYDELSVSAENPAALLARTLPMVSAFIESNWDADAFSVWGLSALGRPLTKESADENFIDEGPEFQGWIIDPKGGKPDFDISRPIAWVFDQ